MRLPLATALLGTSALFAAAPALAVDAGFSGFATLGYALSDSPYTYQRFIDDQGSFKRDTLVAGQLDLHLAPAWSATVQLRAAPHSHDDDKWRVEASLAFLAWRPNNDWLLRAGKFRVPFYMYSEALEVGLAHDMARLPYEMYSITPTNDFRGFFGTRSLFVDAREFSLDGYAGQTDAWVRTWARDGVPGGVPAGANFMQVHVRVMGLVLTGRDPTLTWRLGYHSTRTRRGDGRQLPVTFPRVDVAPGIGYWQIDNALPGPGVPGVSTIRNHIVTAGFEWQLGEGWRVAGEALQMKQRDTEAGSEQRSAYLALFKQIGRFTPYVSLARERSGGKLLEWRRRLVSNPMPAFIPGADQINAANRFAGETLFAYDQHSLALGLSYAIAPQAKLKAEWMRTKVGEASNHFDTPPGQADAQGLRVDTLSVNFNVAF